MLSQERKTSLPLSGQIELFPCQTMQRLLAQLLGFVEAAQCWQDSRRLKGIGLNKRSVAVSVCVCVCIHIHVFIYSFTLNNTAGLLVSKTVSPLVYYHVQMVLLQNIFRCPLHISLPSWACYRVSSEEEICCHRPVWWLYSDSEHWWRIPREGAKSTKPRGWRKYTAPTCIATSFLTKLIKDSRSCRLRDLFFCVPLNSEIF